MAKKKRREIRKVPVEDLQQGPIRHKKGLTPLLEELARAIYSKVGHFVYATFEQWELGFMRDKHPWREILIWESIARAFDLYMTEHADADGRDAATTLAVISTGHVSENETEMEKELRAFLTEAFKRQWEAPRGEPVEFPEDQAIILQYEEIVDEWDGDIHPNLRRQNDPRRVLTDANIILGMEPKSEKCFCLYGRECLEAERIPEGQRTLVVLVDPENEKTQELAKMCFVVQKIKGRHDYQ